MFFLKLLSRLPLSVLYVFSSFIYFMLAYVLRYRKKVIIQNLQNSFPEQTAKWHKKTSKKYYRHLSEIIVEIIKSYSISPTEISKRVEVINGHLLVEEMKAGKSIMVLTAHQGNWEWILMVFCQILDKQVDVVYQQIKNKSFNNFFIEMRSRFGAYAIEKRQFVKEVVKRKDILTCLAILADQTPLKVQKAHWTTFLHQETPFFDGPGKAAKMLNIPVFYVSMQKKQRGYYVAEVSNISNDSIIDEKSLTDAYIRKIEETIQLQPECWLWSHRRWKRKRQKDPLG
ncbi:MAG: lysophospholipid acyltransferase family protein [Cyclobacteriaceae bacterium]